jgi:hypothetical protein
VYNQPTTRLTNGKIVGNLYKGPIDCLWKTIKTEGPLALYKGNDLKTFSRVVKDQQSLYRRFDRPLPAHCTPYVSLPRYVYSECSDTFERIITLTANDIIIGLYKRLRRGTVA